MRFSLLTATAFLTLALGARETIHQAAVRTRELIQYRGMNTAVLMSTYPEDEPGGLGGLPIGLQEYYALYPDSNGDILLLGMQIAKIFRNALPPHAPNLTLTISDTYGFVHSDHGNLAAGRQRVALFGSLEPVSFEDAEEVEKCREAYLAAHPDARGWIPPNGPHSAFWARLRVHKVYDFGGFGDVAFIGWLPLDLYRAAGKEVRSEEEVKHNWPEPIQPEPELVEGGFWAGERNGLFAESAVAAGEREANRGRLVVQW